MIPRHFRSLASNPAVLSLYEECQADHRDSGQTEPRGTPRDLGKETLYACVFMLEKRQTAPFKQTQESFLVDKAHCKAVTLN